MARIKFHYDSAEIETAEKADAIAAEAAFRCAMIRRGLVPPEQIIADGKLHQCDIADLPRGNLRGSYLLHLDSIAAGGFANWCDGLKWQKWNAMMIDRASSEKAGGV